MFIFIISQSPITVDFHDFEIVKLEILRLLNLNLWGSKDGVSFLTTNLFTFLVHT